MSSINKSIETIINNFVENFIDKVVEKYPSTNRDNLTKLWTQIANSSTVTTKAPSRGQDDDEENETKSKSDGGGCPYKFSKGEKSGSICGSKSKNGSTYCSVHKKHEGQEPKTIKKVLPEPKRSSSKSSNTDSKPNTKPVFYKHKPLDILVNKETGFVIKSNTELVVIGKLVDQTVKNLNLDDVDTCIKWRLHYDEKMVEKPQEEEEDDAPQEENIAKPVKDDSDSDEEPAKAGKEPAKVVPKQTKEPIKVVPKPVPKIISKPVKDDSDSDEEPAKAGKEPVKEPVKVVSKESSKPAPRLISKPVKDDSDSDEEPAKHIKEPVKVVPKPVISKPVVKAELKPAQVKMVVNSVTKSIKPQLDSDEEEELEEELEEEEESSVREVKNKSGYETDEAVADLDNKPDTKTIKKALGVTNDDDLDSESD